MTSRKKIYSTLFETKTKPEQEMQNDSSNIDYKEPVLLFPTSKYLS